MTYLGTRGLRIHFARWLWSYPRWPRWGQCHVPWRSCQPWVWSQIPAMWLINGHFGARACGWFHYKNHPWHHDESIISLSLGCCLNTAWNGSRNHFVYAPSHWETTSYQRRLSLAGHILKMIIAKAYLDACLAILTPALVHPDVSRPLVEYHVNTTSPECVMHAVKRPVYVGAIAHARLVIRIRGIIWKGSRAKN